MKKLIYMTALLLVSIMSLTSCGDDEPKEKTTVRATYSMSFSQDLLKACNVIITYKAENGRNVIQPISSDSPTWTKAVTSDKFPAEFGVYYQFSPLADGELTQEKYDLSCNLQFSMVTSKGASYTNNYTIIDNKGVSRDKVVAYLKGQSNKSKGFRVTENGVVSEATNLKYDD